jgi:hypothetical protein
MMTTFCNILVAVLRPHNPATDTKKVTALSPRHGKKKRMSCVSQTCCHFSGYFIRGRTVHKRNSDIVDMKVMWETKSIRMLV